MTGRTSWWGKDCAFNERELIVELGERFGPGGPLVMDEMNADAKKQRNGGYVKTGYRSLARRCFLPSAQEARKIVEAAAEMGALDEYTPDDDGRRFTARVSGFIADQQHAQAAARQQAKRARDAEPGVTDRDEALLVTPGHVSTGQDRTEETPLSSELDGARIENELFAYWQQQCGHSHAKFTRDRRAKVRARLREGYTPDQIRRGIDGAARAAFTNDAGKRFDDLELVCRTGSKLEAFIDKATPQNGRPAAFNAASFVAAINREPGTAA